MENFKVGDIVIFKTQSELSSYDNPRMLIIEDIKASPTWCLCGWFNRRGDYCTDSFRIESLIKQEK